MEADYRTVSFDQKDQFHSENRPERDENCPDDELFDKIAPSGLKSRRKFGIICAAWE